MFAFIRFLLFVCLPLVTYAAVIHGENSLRSAARTGAQTQENPSPLSPEAIAAKENDLKSFLSRNVVPTDGALTTKQVGKLWQSSRAYQSVNNVGVSRDDMVRAFKQNLGPKVSKHIIDALGGTILEYGEADNVTVSNHHNCTNRPSLTIEQVQEVARMSFGVADFNLTFPPCDNGGELVDCTYPGNKCCRRPQVEFTDRYYDTAVAAMALGATRDEAFAPLIHSRVLSYILMTCDPDLSYRGDIQANSFRYRVKSKVAWIAPYDRDWSGNNTGLVAFPPAYEVLYELYNTMLIERMRSRRTTEFPTAAQMQALNVAVYYKKMMARATYLDLDLNPDIVFPNSFDFDFAGLVMATSSRMTELSRMTKPAASILAATHTSELEQYFGFLENTISVYEYRTQQRKTLDSLSCNDLLTSTAYYPFKFQDSVWSKFEGCCAFECKFLALYGKSFSAHSSNCCAGCNRHRCAANDAATAEFFAEVATIEAPSKTNSGVEEITFMA